MIVTIDGPAGAGKSSVARALAKRLDFAFLDTGAMYRAVAWAALQRDVSWSDKSELVRLATSLSIDLREQTVLVEGQDVTQAIRTAEVTSVIHHVADLPGVREQLVRRQREWAHGKDVVSEGRDQGTVVFPHAECKIFLTASASERAKRRQQEMEARGESIDWEEILRQQNQRDQRDTTRPVGRLCKADDAVELITDGLDREQVVDRLVELVQQRQAVQAEGKSS